MEKRALWLILCLLGTIYCQKICPSQRPYRSTITTSTTGHGFQLTSNPPCMKTCPTGASTVAPGATYDGSCKCPGGASTIWTNFITGQCDTKDISAASSFWNTAYIKQISLGSCPDPNMGNAYNYCACLGTWTLSLDGQQCLSACPANTYKVQTLDNANYCVCNQGAYLNYEKNACYIGCPSNSDNGFYCTISGADTGLCDTGCATCSGNSYTCQTCTVGYGISGTTCSLCTGTTQCSTCDTGCASCSSTSSNCQSCIAGYGLAGGNTCTQCTGATFSTGGTGACSNCDPGCATCSGTSSNCQSCDVGYGISGSTCSLCTGSTQCSSCATGCASCSGTSSNCGSCISGYTQQGSTCTLTVAPRGTGGNTGNGGSGNGQNGDSDGMSRGAIIGTAVGVSVGVMLILAVGFLLFKNCKPQKVIRVQQVKIAQTVDTA